MSTVKKYTERIFYIWKEKGIKPAYNYTWFTFVNKYMYPLRIFNSKTFRKFWTKLFSQFEPYPRLIEVEVTTRCNLKCIMCEHTYWNEKPRDMTFREFKYIIDQFPNLIWIGLTGIGNSFLNKDFLKMLRYVKSKGVYVEIFDTLSLINRKIAKELVKMSIDHLIISIDAATKETYEKIRVGAKFDKVIDNIKYLIQLKKKYKTYFPEIGFHYIVSKPNFHEVVKFIDFVRFLGAEEETEVSFTRLLHTFKEVKNIDADISNEIIKTAEERAKKLGIRLLWSMDVPRVKPPINLCTAWTEPFIFVTGHVIPCCVGNEANKREFQKTTALGNIFEKPFKEIWYSEKYRKLRNDIKKGELPLPCKFCTIFESRRSRTK